MTLAAWLHTLDPYIWEIRPGFGLRWYGLSYVLGLLVAWVLLRGLARRGVVAIPAERVPDALLLIFLCAVVGGRLGYAVFYNPSLLWTFSQSAPWWNLLAINKGGMASHGGMLGVVIGAWIVSRGFKGEGGEGIGRCPPLHVMDTMCLLGPFGLFFGRVANFVNGELLGRVAAEAGEPAPWWSVRFPQEVIERPESLTALQRSELPGAIGMRRMELPPWDSTLKPVDNPPWAAFLERYDGAMVQLQAGSVEVAERLTPLLNARHPSQLYQAVAEGVVVGAVVWWVARRPRVPGVIGCWFMMTYGVLRITTEVWRLPDAHLEAARVLGLSRGQWLSAAMVLAGALLLLVVTRRGGTPMGGWRQPARQATDPPAAGGRASDA